MDIDINHIRRLDGGLLLVFRELAATGQATVAAERLGLSQSAVSHALRRLRTALGDVLFERRPNGLVPTARTLQLVPVVEEILALSQALAPAGGTFDPFGSRRHFQIAAADLISTLLAAPLTRRFQVSAPQARFSFSFLVGQAACEAVRRGDVDVAIGRFHALPRGVASTLLFEEHFVVIARRGHPALAKGLDLATFLSLDHLLVSFLGRVTGPVDEVLQAKGLRRRVTGSLPLFLGVFDAVARSDAIATVSNRLADRLAAPFGLDVWPVPIDVPAFPVVAVRRAPPQRDPGFDWLMNEVKAACEASAGHLDACAPDEVRNAEPRDAAP